MQETLDNQLCQEFPLLYADRHESMMRTCMCWGFDVGPGWFQLIHDLSSKLEPLIQKFIDANQNNIDYAEQIASGKPWWPRASQVKEKFGGLRFYMTESTNEMDDLISAAEVIAEQTCDVCGNPGKLSGSGWISCRCPDHIVKKSTTSS